MAEGFLGLRWYLQKACVRRSARSILEREHQSISGYSRKGWEVFGTTESRIIRRYSTGPKFCRFHRGGVRTENLACGAYKT